MRTVALDEAFSDIAVSSPLADGRDAVRVRVVEALRFRRGSWFMDAGAGIPYLTDILGQAPSETVARRLLLDAVLAVDGVLSVEDSAFSYDRRTRRMEFSMVLRTETGDVRVASDTEV